MRLAWRWVLLACLLWATGVYAQAVPGELQVGGDGRYGVSRSFVYFLDPGGTLGVEEVSAPAMRDRFRPVPDAGPGANFGLTDAAIWLRVNLRATQAAPRDWLLEIAYPPLDEVQLFVPGPHGFARQTGGDSQPFSARAVEHRNHIMRLSLEPGHDTVIYLRLHSTGTVSAPVTLWQPAALWRSDQVSYAGLSLYFGLLIGLFLYNLLLFISVRDGAYLVYVLFAGWMGIGQAALTGVGAQFLWPEWTWWNSVSPVVGLSAAAVFGLLFARTFLASAERMPRIDRLLLLQVAGWLLCIVVALVAYGLSTQLASVLSVLSVATMFTVGIVSIRHQVAGARYFMGAWGLLLVGVVTLSLHNTGVLPTNALTSNSMLIGSALEMVLLSFALGDRIKVARRFKEMAQARIAAEHAMVEVLRDSQERLKRVLEEREIILESSIVGIAFLTSDGRLRWANQAMHEIFGVPRSTRAASMEPFYLSREQYLEVGGEVADAVRRGEVFEREFRMRRWDGTPIWISLSGKAVSRTDLSQGTVWVIMNITQRKELEAQLQRTSSEREAILNSALVGIVLSVRRTHEWVNEKFAQMLGYPRQVLIGQSSRYIHPDEESWEQFGREARAALLASGSYVCERQLRRRTGELLWVQMGGSCVRPNDPDSGVIWTFLDITERRKSEAGIREALEQQKALNELRSRFVAMTSHEFRTPLSAIMSAEEILRHYGERLPPEERGEVLDSIAAGAQRISRMMDRVLLIGKADAGMLDFQPQRIALPALCTAIAEEARVQQPNDRCHIALDLDGAPAEGEYDDKLLRHIFGNLLSNALKYSPAGGQVRFCVRGIDEGTLFEVSDQGIGIPPEEIPYLFGPFHRASNVGAIQGTGLGLAIVKNAVERHGGRIEVASRPGEGTSFRVSIPR